MDGRSEYHMVLEALGLLVLTLSTFGVENKGSNSSYLLLCRVYANQNVMDDIIDVTMKLLDSHIAVFNSHLSQQV